MSTDIPTWKGRFIVTQDGYVDLPPDRQHYEGPEADKDRFLGHLSEVMPARTLFGIIARKLQRGEIKTREAAEVVIMEDAGVRIAGNSNASAGYFYVTATEVQP